jgi:hypothetical protein
MRMMMLHSAFDKILAHVDMSALKTNKGDEVILYFVIESK